MTDQHKIDIIEQAFDGWAIATYVSAQDRAEYVLLCGTEQIDQWLVDQGIDLVGVIKRIVKIQKDWATENGRITVQRKMQEALGL